MKAILTATRKRLFLILLIATLIGCNSKNKNSILDIQKTTSQKVFSAVIDSINLEINNGDYGLVDRFMIIQNDSVLADFKYKQDYETIVKKYDTTNHQYNFNNTDWHPYYKNSELHTLQSVTKSITSILLGIALDLNKEYNVSSKAMPLIIGNNITLKDEHKQNISIEDLLTMRSGLQWNEETDHNDTTNDCFRLESSDNWIDYVLSKPMEATPGTKFVYNGGATVLLGKIVRTITNKRIDLWAEEKLFKPLGITDYYWKETPDGEIDTEGGLYLKAEDLAKIGSLLLNKGKWNDTQIVSESWVTTSTSPILKDVKPKWRRDMGYGYQWWIPEYSVDGKTRIYAGNGYGGQYLMMAPVHNLIIVFNGWNINSEPKKSTWSVLQDRILPALKIK
ncbi:serine hydrolase [Algibacter amylolyticus]|uniref:Serine hydrolase n=1 Tax=Algibacter amylolyticus TaxID=1608400 RepID=A0A5M7B9L1_9FLAO|nr:serine hydrolase [Algibacter amylolyticus]KAA5824101.1 serine hydrolase [Algibacter amylolyticus]MBB5269658.1 CubicO group peptidase (beta-lactamase class C family) [Algibacter amylolyticus]TSJ74578.1 serine hydrolase [Algibacter amylolyticus]